MPAVEENFSKIVRSLLLDVDIHLEQLEQIGYLSKEQRAFLDKFLYKSEDALRAATLTCGSRGSDLLLTKLPPAEEKSPNGLTPSPSKSENGISTLTSRALPCLRSVTEQLRAEENGLTAFLKRCRARNFSVKVRGIDIGKEPTNKVKGSEYILALEPIAEGTAKVGGSKVDTKVHNGKLPEPVHHNTNMVLHGADTLTRDKGIEAVDYKTTVLTEAVADLSLDNIESIVHDAVDIEDANNETINTKAEISNPPIVEPTNLQLAIEPVKVEPVLVEAIKVNLAESKPSDDDITSIRLPEAALSNEQEKSESTYQWEDTIALQRPCADDAEEVETNAWGKPIKPDPTRNKEGAIVGVAAKPLGVENKGLAMMEKMGWSKGTGLGKQKHGIQQPLSHVVKNTKAGLRSLDENRRKSVLNPLSFENVPSIPAEEQSVTPDNIPGLTVADNSAWGRRVDTPKWDQPVKLDAEQMNASTEKAATDKHVEEPNRVEATTIKAKPEAIGIKAFYLNEGDNPDSEKAIMFNTRIRATNEYKTTMHCPGVRIRAITPQGSHYSKRADDSSFKVWTGNVLEVLRAHQGDEYHVFCFRSKKRGIVKISLVEMMEEPQAMLADGRPWPTIPATATPATATSRA